MDGVLTYLAQNRPSGTSAVSLFSPEAGQQVILKRIWIANVSNSTVKYTLYFDNDGTTYDETTAIKWNVSLAAGANDYVDLDIPMRNSSGNFAIQTSSANDLNFTLIGEV